MRIGILGFGFMGRMHYRCWKARADVRIAAICDADAAALSGSGQGRGNIPGAEGEVDLRGVAIYSSPQELFAREPLDAVSITLPTHLHAPCAIQALKAGCHVLCEKPMALTLDEGRRMIEAAERAGKVLQIGHCIRFWPEYARAREIAGSGAYGRVISASFLRLSATLHARKGSWFGREDQSGGMLSDLHIHDTDFIQHLFGMPAAVCSHGTNMPEIGLAHVLTSYRYSDGKLVTAEGGWALVPSHGFEMQFRIVLERAVLSFGNKQSPTLRLHTLDGEAPPPAIEPGDGYSRQIEHFVRAARGEPVPPLITPEQAWNSLRIVEAERESARKGTHVELL